MLSSPETSPENYWAAMQRAGSDLVHRARTVSNLIVDIYRADRVIYVCGNGGSASTASHFACDLAWGTRGPGRAALRAIALTDQHALLSALENDTSHEEALEWLVRCQGRPGDALVCISASGNSENVIRAARAANDIGMETVGLVGFHGGTLGDVAGTSIHVAVNDYGVVEDLHLMLCHVISYGVRDLLETRAVAVLDQARSP